MSRDEWPTLAKAELAAQRTVHNYHDARVMIYAVAGGRNTWVKTVKQEQVKHAPTTGSADTASLMAGMMMSMVRTAGLVLAIH